MEGNLIELLTLQNYGNRTRPILVLLSKEFFFSTFDQKIFPSTHSNTLLTKKARYFSKKGNTFVRALINSKHQNHEKITLIDSVVLPGC